MENKERRAQPKRGLWKPEEDLILKNYVETHGEGNWATVSKRSGLMRGGKSCRLRWKNYLRPNIKRGGMSKEEEDLIIRMHKLLGNRWSLIAGRLPGRTDNEVKNYWNTHLNKKTVLGKRKAMDSNDQHSEKESMTEDESLQLQGGKKATPLQYDSHQRLDMDEKKQVKKEDRTMMDRDSSWIGHVHMAAQAQVQTQTQTQTQAQAQVQLQTEALAQAQCFNYDYEYDIVGTPLMMHPNYSNFVFDEDPFTAYLDSFVLFEAFGTGSEFGFQSFLP